MITTTIINSSLVKLFIGYSKVIILPEIKNRIENRFGYSSKVISQHCYGDLMKHSWETLKFYIKDIDTLFSINIGVDSGRNKENFGQDVIFIEANIYKGKNDGNIIYVESDKIELWQYILNDFYHKLVQYLDLNT